MNALAVSEAAYAAHELGPHAAAASSLCRGRRGQQRQRRQKRGGRRRQRTSDGDKRAVSASTATKPWRPRARRRRLPPAVLPARQAPLRAGPHGDGRTLLVGFAGTTDARDLWADVNLLQDALPGWEAVGR